jgi:hypothetical protein
MCRHRFLLPPSYANFFSHLYSLKVTVFADGTPYSLVEIFRLGEAPSYSGTVLNYKIKAAGSSEPAQNFYRIRRCHISEASTHDHSSGEVTFLPLLGVIKHIKLIEGCWIKQSTEMCVIANEKPGVVLVIRFVLSSATVSGLTSYRLLDFTQSL